MLAANAEYSDTGCLLLLAVAVAGIIGIIIKGIR